MSLNDRAKEMEARYQHDEELTFKVNSRRDYLFGQWVAQQLGEQDQDAYARTIVAESLKLPGDEDIFAKVLADAASAGISMTVEDCRAMLTQFLEQAKQDLT